MQYEFYYEKILVNEMTLSYFNGYEQDWSEIMNGKVTFSLTGNYSAIKTNLLPQIEYIYENEMAKDKEIYSIHKSLNLPSFGLFVDR